MLYTDGDACPDTGILLSGEVRVFKIGEGGKEITLYEVFLGETCILNASCILTHTYYPANAVAVADSDVLTLSEQVFRKLISEYDDMRNFLFYLFSELFAAIMELIEEVAFRKMD